MELHVREWGQGDRVAILLHGMMGSSDSWWRVAPALIDRGYRVLVDAPTLSRGGRDRDEVRAEYEQDRTARTFEELLRTHPHYDEQDARVEADAARSFDPDTAAAVAPAGGGSWPAQAGTIVVRAAPSSYISNEAADVMRRNGVIVHDLPGALHSVWYSHYDEFLALIPA